MAKNDTNAEVENADAGDAPLIDLNEASIKKLLARAKKRGVITYDELNEALPQDQMSSEQIEDIMSALNDMGVNIVENDESGEDGESEKEAEDDERDPELDREANTFAARRLRAKTRACIADLM